MRASRPSLQSIFDLRRFLETEAGGGIVLMISAVLAMVLANSPWAGSYFATLEVHLGPLSLLHWVNDGLMALFFLLVGLEIKRELLVGELNSWPRRALPGVAALGGMVVPALIYLAVTAGHPAVRAGWAVPAATDIAFALGVLALLGKRVPLSLKVFLSALAIVDDLGAILIIALAYGRDLDLGALSLAAVMVAALAGLGRLKVLRLWPYLGLGAGLWVAVLASGIHATVAGVLLALLIPIGPHGQGQGQARGPLHRLETGLSPYVAYLVVPVFGLANAGVSLAGMGIDSLVAPESLGVILGLVLGKPLGIVGFSLLAIAMGVARLPDDVRLAQFVCVAMVGGIGFTMSLFIGSVAFASEEVLSRVRLAVMIGSLLSGSLAALGFVYFSSPKARQNSKLI